jgi:hypothetical protein
MSYVTSVSSPTLMSFPSFRDASGSKKEDSKMEWTPTTRQLLKKVYISLAVNGTPMQAYPCFK